MTNRGSTRKEAASERPLVLLCSHAEPQSGTDLIKLQVCRNKLNIFFQTSARKDVRFLLKTSWVAWLRQATQLDPVRGAECLLTNLLSILNAGYKKMNWQEVNT